MGFGFKTDGELYDECLTASSVEELIMKYKKILGFVEKVGYIAIWNIVDLVGKGIPTNMEYAITHGWSRLDVNNFAVKYCDDGKWRIFLGNPRILTDSERNQPTYKKYMVVLSPEKKIPEDGWDVALNRIRLYVNAENAKAAREMAVKAMKVHFLYCKVVYIREMKPEAE